MRRIVTCVSALALWPLATAVSSAPVGSSSGIYLPGQAEEGAEIYAAQCAMCHGVRLEGTVEIPALTGKFMANWAGRPVGDLYDYLGRAMPQSAPGSLTAQDNARLVAFLLKANGAPTGTAALPADSAALRRIAFDPARISR